MFLLPLQQAVKRFIKKTKKTPIVHCESKNKSEKRNRTYKDPIPLE